MDLRLGAWLLPGYLEWESEIRELDNIHDVSVLATTLVGNSDENVTFVAARASTDCHPNEIVAAARLSAKDLSSHDDVCHPWLAAVFVPMAEESEGMRGEWYRR